MIEEIDAFDTHFIAFPESAPMSGIIFDRVEITRYESTGNVEFRLMNRGVNVLVCLDVEDVEDDIEKSLRRIAEEEPKTKKEREALLPTEAEA